MELTIQWLRKDSGVLLTPELTDEAILNIIPKVCALRYAVDGRVLVITSGSEGKKGDGVHKNSSLHYPENSPSGKGRAIDVRDFDESAGDIQKSHDALEHVLGSDYDVVIESTHIHIEYQPKGLNV